MNVFREIFSTPNTRRRHQALGLDGRGCALPLTVMDSLAEQAAIVGMPLSRYVAALLTEAARGGPRPALRWTDGQPDPDGPDDPDPDAPNPGGAHPSATGDAVVISLSRARHRRARAALRSYPPASARGPDTG